MVYRSISRDVKIAAIRLFERGLIPLHDILFCCNMSERTFYRILILWRGTGDVVTNEATSLILGRPRRLEHDDVRYLLQLVKANPDFFLDELLDLLKTNRFISIHYTTIHKELVRAGVSRKRLQQVTREHNENLCAAFISRMA
jgi:transposase